MIWAGSISNIPKGWQICNGANGTPNLLDRFLVGAGSSYSVGTIGGEAFHTLTVSEMPSHRHSIMSIAGHSDFCRGIPESINAMGGPAGAASGYYDTFNSGIQVLSNTGGNQSHENRPPYYAVCYLMKL